MLYFLNALISATNVKDKSYDNTQPQTHSVRVSSEMEIHQMDSSVEDKFLSEYALYRDVVDIRTFILRVDLMKMTKRLLEIQNTRLNVFTWSFVSGLLIMLLLMKRFTYAWCIIITKRQKISKH